MEHQFWSTRSTSTFFSIVNSTKLDHGPTQVCNTSCQKSIAKLTSTLTSTKILSEILAPESLSHCQKLQAVSHKANQLERLLPLCFVTHDPLCIPFKWSKSLYRSFFFFHHPGSHEINCQTKSGGTVKHTELPRVPWAHRSAKNYCSELNSPLTWVELLIGTTWFPFSDSCPCPAFPDSFHTHTLRANPSGSSHKTAVYFYSSHGSVLFQLSSLVLVSLLSFPLLCNTH